MAWILLLGLSVAVTAIGLMMLFWLRVPRQRPEDDEPQYKRTGEPPAGE